MRAERAFDRLDVASDLIPPSRRDDVSGHTSLGEGSATTRLSIAPIGTRGPAGLAAGTVVCQGRHGHMESRKRNLGPAIAATHTKSATPLVGLGEVAAFVACDRPAAMTGNGCESDRRRNRRLIDLSRMILCRAERYFHRSAGGRAFVVEGGQRCGHRRYIGTGPPPGTTTDDLATAGW